MVCLWFVYGLFNGLDLMKQQIDIENRLAKIRNNKIDFDKMTISNEIKSQVNLFVI